MLFCLHELYMNWILQVALMDRKLNRALPDTAMFDLDELPALNVRKALKLTIELYGKYAIIICPNKLPASRSCRQARLNSEPESI